MANNVLKHLLMCLFAIFIILFCEMFFAHFLIELFVLLLIF